MGDTVIANVEQLCRSDLEAHPADMPHQIFARVWQARMMANGKAWGMRPELREMTAMSETQEFACMRFSDGARALGLWLLRQERPDIFLGNAKYGTEFTRLMMKLAPAIAEDTLSRVYRELNPGTGWKFLPWARSGP